MKFVESIVDNKSDKPALKILSLSNNTGATKNMTVYECGGDIIVVDCGVGFPDEELLGIDVVLPDITYLLENRDKVRGFFITHAHEDHLGAIPYVIGDLEVPIYSNEIVQNFLKSRLEDKSSKQVAQAVKFHLIKPGEKEIVLGNFRVSAFRTNHSVPDPLGFEINTPQGRVVHMADYKIDENAVFDEPMDFASLERFGKEGTLCLLSDCLNVIKPGRVESESVLNETFINLFRELEGRQIFITIISSAISRMKQIIDGAVANNRKVVFVGRSMYNHGTIARKMGYLDYPDDVFVSGRKADKFEQDSLVYIIAGCFGTPGSGLERLSRGDNKNLTLEKNAAVIFSSTPGPPSSHEPVGRVKDNLVLQGAEVIAPENRANLHISGHGYKEELETVVKLVKPKNFIPIGAGPFRVREYTKMVGELGFDMDSSHELLEGESVIFEDGRAREGKKIEVKQVFVDGSKVGDVGAVVIKDREQLADDGIFVVVVAVSKDGNKIVGRPEIVTRGFIFVKESMPIIKKAEKVVNRVLNNHQGKLNDWNFVRARVEKELGKFLYKETGRNPLIIVSSLTV